VSGAAGGQGETGGALVMIVDPNPDVREILGMLLQHEGFAALSTTEPDEALEWARERGPAVIVGEHPLELSDGRLLCAALREDPRTAAIPFVAVTAHGFPDDVESAVEGHPHGVFVKPVRPLLLLEHIRSLTDGR
jgi:CheY-like chemotaxis protein